jgi:ABC-type antimicrobial peptide transport system permease subunit
LGLGEEIKESVIVQKVLRSLPMRFDPKISTLEEREDLNLISMDKLHGIFTTYEMRTEQENPYIKETSLNVAKRSKKKRKQKEKEHSSSSDVSEDDEEVANFVRRLKKGKMIYIEVSFLYLVLIMMVLVIFLTNVLIRKREMMKVTQIANKHIKAKVLIKVGCH